MHAFTDNKGREWPITINVVQIRRTRDETGVDCFRLFDDRLKGFDALLSDPCKFVEVLFSLCRSVCKERGVDADSFAEALAGDCLEDAGHAFFEELLDFFPGRSQREAIRLAVARQRDLREEILRLTREKMEQTSSNEEAMKVLEAMAQSSPPSGDVPESSASTQDHSP